MIAKLVRLFLSVNTVIDYDWVLSIREQCIRKQVSFEFRQCGTHFIKDGKQYRLQTKDLCSQARKANIDYHKTGKERALR